MFDDIKNSMKPTAETVYKDMLKFESGKTYLLRLVPNLDQPKKSLYHYYHHSWTSLATNKFVTAICPTTFGESCPICSHAIKTFRSGTNEEKEKNKLINRKENWLANAYVVTDPTKPENAGKVKILRYGRELAKIIDEAINGEDASEYGPKIFDVRNGCTLRVKCEARSNAQNKKYLVTYASSKFVSASPLEVENIDDIHNNIFTLEEVSKPSSAPELQRLLEQHYFCSVDAVQNAEEDEDENVVAAKTVKKQFSNDIENVFSGVEDAKDVVENKNDNSLDDLDEELRGILEKY